MIKLEDDPIIGGFIDTPEKKAKWLVRIKIAYIIWIILIILGIFSLLLYYLFK